MSPIDPSQLRRGKRAYVDVIESDRQCGQCGYNLRGLPTNGKCPECGKDIAGRGRGFRRFSDNLTDAPLFYLKTLAIGTWMLAVAGIGTSLCNFYASYTWRIEWAIAAGVASIVWWMGVFIVSGQRSFGEHTLRDPLLDTAWLRTTNRIVHTAWIAAAGCWIIATQVPATATTAQDYWRAGAGFLQGIGVLGFITLALQMAALADWARDTTLSERLKVTATTMTIAGIIVVAGAIAAAFHAKGIAVGFLGLGLKLSLIIMSLAKLVFLFCLVQLANIAFWAVSNNATAASTDRRLLQQRDSRAQELADRSALAIALQDAGPPMELTSDAPAQTAFESNVIDRPEDLNPYALEPDPPPRDAGS